MDVRHFLDHWKLQENPFQAEEARTDAVYLRALETSVTHPDFGKIFGDPANPGTTLVFGEKGSGKTAMRLLLQQRYADYNKGRETGRVWVTPCDEHNPMLDAVAHKLGKSEPDSALDAVRLEDQQDAILSRTVTGLVDALVGEEGPEGGEAALEPGKLDAQQRADLAMAAWLYDQPTHGQSEARWQKIRSLTRMGTFWNRKRHGLLALLFLLVGLVAGAAWRYFGQDGVAWQATAVAGGGLFLATGLGWLGRQFSNGRRGRALEREVRVINRAKGDLSRKLWTLKGGPMKAQPLPTHDDKEARYNLTRRVVRILNAFGYGSLVVLIDRVDEPVLINGDAQRMKKFVWPMMNNKFLQQEHVAIKMLLPIEVAQQLPGESAEFKRTARLDKQSVVNPLKWTGETLYDLCNHRIKSVQPDGEGEKMPLQGIFTDEVTRRDLIEALDQMHQPRDAFKLLYAVIVEHCQVNPSDSENWRIPGTLLSQVRRDQSKRVTELYRGNAVG